MGHGWLYGILIGAVGIVLMFNKKGISTPVMLTATWTYGVYAAIPFCNSGKQNEKVVGINYYELLTCGGNIITVGLILVIIWWRQKRSGRILSA